MNSSSEPDLAARLGDLLRRRGWTLATAESCTGGLVGNLITNIAGSSDYYMGGLITYSNDAKENLLGVRRKTLVQYGAVSAETVEEMARGACQALHVDVAVSVSGIAGPGGGTPEKPVGLVWFGISTPSGEQAYQRFFKGNRVEVKRMAAETALQLLMDNLQEESHGTH